MFADDQRARPRYVQVEESLHTLLKTGGYRAGDKLPPEPELAQQMGVSRATLREALRSFEQQGIISRRQGVGTFVNAQPLSIDTGLETLASIEMVLRTRQLQPNLVHRHVRAEKALPKAASRLTVSEGSTLTVSSSTYAIGQERAAYLLEVVPAAVLAQDQAEPLAQSLLDFLLHERERFDLAYSVAHIAPVHGSEEICTALGIDANTPLFFIEQTAYTSANVPRYYSRNYYLPDFFDFHLIRRV